MRYTKFRILSSALAGSILIGTPPASAAALRCSSSSAFLALPPCAGSSASLQPLKRKRGMSSLLSSSSSADDTDKQVLILPLRDHLISSTEEIAGDGSVCGRGKIRLILASKSPRRSEILSMMGLENRFEVIPSPLDEEKLQVELQGTEDPKEYTRVLAEEKAKALANELLLQQQQEASSSQASTDHDSSSPVLVLGSDTIVSFDGHVLEKPKDPANAKEMLSKLSGQEHEVHTGVCLVGLLAPSSSSPSSVSPQQLAFEHSFVDTAEVRFATLTEDDIDAYVATCEPNDKAGSYGIQGMGGQFVSSVTGDFFTVSVICFSLLSAVSGWASLFRKKYGI